MRRDGNGKTYVDLDPFNQAWYGDHYALLVVKGGSSGGDGFGNAIYLNPSDAARYYAPNNSGGQQADVSHWIVCKGVRPAPTTTSTTTTTTTAPPTTTSTTTTQPRTPTTAPPTTVPPTVPPTAVVPPRGAVPVPATPTFTG